VWEVFGERESLVFAVAQSMVVVVVLWDGRVLGRWFYTAECFSMIRDLCCFVPTLRCGLVVGKAVTLWYAPERVNVV
jgi:hypothetical protein